MSPASPYENMELIMLLKKRDPEACDWLYEKYAGSLYTLVSQVIPDPAEKNETLREIFVTILDRIEIYDPAKNRLFTWMMNIARELIYQRVHLHLPEGEPYEESGIGNLMKKLSPEEKKLLHLSWFKGYSTEEVARHLEISPAAARTRIRNTLLQLKTLL